MPEAMRISLRAGSFSQKIWKMQNASRMGSSATVTSRR